MRRVNWGCLAPVAYGLLFIGLLAALAKVLAAL